PVTAVVVHGGAGVIRPNEMPPELEAACRAGLRSAIDAGRDVLDRGGTALDAVVAAVQVLEECEHFNAGRGAVLHRDGVAELEAGVRDGRTREAGAVAGITTVRSPVALARDVMRHTPHVLMIAAGAEQLATELGHEQVDNAWFVTDRRMAELTRALAA